MFLLNLTYNNKTIKLSQSNKQNYNKKINWKDYSSIKKKKSCLFTKHQKKKNNN